MTARNAGSAEFVTNGPDMAQLPTTDASGPRIGSGGPTDTLRHALDARHVEHWDDDGDLLRVTVWDGRGGRASFREWRTGTTRFEANGVTPAQAVAATIGEVDG